MTLFYSKLNCFALALISTIWLITIKLLTLIVSGGSNGHTANYLNGILFSKSTTPQSLLSLESGMVNMLTIFIIFMIIFLILLLFRHILLLKNRPTKK